MTVAEVCDRPDDGRIRERGKILLNGAGVHRARERERDDYPEGRDVLIAIARRTLRDIPPSDIFEW